MHYHERIAARFDGRDLVKIYSDAMPPQQLAAIAYERGYVFAWGWLGRNRKSGTFCFRRLFPAQ
ncbi:hypothetical protein [Rhodococcus sp. NPDC049939]|uniref:hypothetical protein n=1 Tax=Rhodococcus sp. NPDC049939 TaxID=3155511 RepID=UPI0033D4A62F